MKKKEKISWFIIHNKGQEFLALYSINQFMIENKLTKFSNKEVEEYLVKKLNQVGDISFSRDLSNPISKNTIGSGKSYSNKNKGWYEGKKKDKKITDKGFKELEKLDIYINEQIDLYKNTENEANLNRINKKADSKLISEIVAEIKSGNFAQIPTFQREYVWNYKSVAPLLLSILKDFPIGSLLYWYENNDDNYVILDGLQRTFSLTLIDNHNYAYIDYDLYKYYVSNKLKKDLFISEIEFNKCLIKWKSSFNDTSEDKHTEEEMFMCFNFNPQIISLVEYIKYKWNLIRDIYSVPFIRLNNNFKKDEAADIFNIINSTGKDLNKLEVNSSIWSKTPIVLDSSLTEDDNLIVWKRKKESKYRNKIKTNKDIDVLVDTGNKIFEVSDFIYSTFEMATKKCPLIKEMFYSDNRLKPNAIEPLITIYINYFMVINLEKEIESHDKMMPKLGKVISSEIKNKAQINSFIKKLEKSLKTVENKLSLLKTLATNSQKISISAPVSLISLLINISLTGSKEAIENLLYIFTHEYFIGKYTTGSTKNAWAEYKSKGYLKWDMSVANEIIVNYINQEHNRPIARTSYDKKMVFVLALFKQVYAKENFKTSHQIDHIVPKAVIELSSNSNQNKIETNHLNTFYNLQLLDDTMNKEKSSNMDFKDERFVFLSINDEKFNCVKYKEDFIKKFKKVKNSLCNEMKNGYCKKMGREVSYESFEKLINYQKKMIEPLIKKGLFK